MAACKRLVRVARLIRERDRNEPEPQLTPSLVEQWQPDDPLDAHRANYHLELAESHRRLGETEAMASNYRAALTFNSNLPEAHHYLAKLRMPGDDYRVWLERLYVSLVPETVVEIGVGQGESLALLRPPTIAIGIDPAANVVVPFKAKTHIFAETSDEFFAQRRTDKLLAGRPLSIGFIDGLHLYEQVLRDFIYLEACCGPRSVILFHDTVPLNQTVQSRIRKTLFYTGDVWKTVLCLKHYREDLDIFTIAAPLSGLTVVTGLNPKSRVLTRNYEEAVARFIDLPFSEIESDLDTTLNLVPNDWRIVRARLEARGVFPDRVRRQRTSPKFWMANLRDFYRTISGAN